MVLVYDTLSHCALEVHDSFNDVQLTERTKNLILKNKHTRVMVHVHDTSS